MKGSHKDVLDLYNFIVGFLYNIIKFEIVVFENKIQHEANQHHPVNDPEVTKNNHTNYRVPSLYGCTQ